MDRHRSRRSASRSPRRRRRRSSRSPSRSRSRSIVDRASLNWGARKGWVNTDQSGDRYQPRRRSPSASHERRLYRREREVSSSGRSYTSRRSRSRSLDINRSQDVSRWDSSHRRSPSPRRRLYHTRQRSPSLQRQSPSPRRYKKYVSCHRSRSPRRSSSPRRQCPSPHRRSSSPRRQYSPSPHRRSLSLRNSSFSPQDRSVSPRRRRSRSRSLRRDRASRSRSDSRWRRSEDEASRSGSSRGPSSSRYNDTRAMNPLETKPSLTLSAGSPPAAKPIDPSDKKHDVRRAVKESAKLEDKSFDEPPHLSATGSHDDHGSSLGYNHLHLQSRRPFPDARAPSSSPAAPHESSTPPKSVTILDRVTVSSPRGGHSSALTPTMPSDGNGNHLVVVNPVLEKMREAQRESHRAYLKGNSDYNRAEMKSVSIEGELRLAEFWLKVVTKNLEDVGKRIEVHDWNFQKIANQDGVRRT